MLKLTTMTVALVLVVSVSACTTRSVTYEKPICSPAPYPELPFIPDDTISLMGPESRDDLYEIYDKLVNWGEINESIVRQLCKH